MTDSLPRKELLGQVMGQGFLPDSHCPTGAPRESIVKITKAEPGGLGGQGLWRPAKLGPVTPPTGAGAGVLAAPKPADCAGAAAATPDAAELAGAPEPPDLPPCRPPWAIPPPG